MRAKEQLEIRDYKNKTFFFAKVQKYPLPYSKAKGHLWQDRWGHFG